MFCGAERSQGKPTDREIVRDFARRLVDGAIHEQTEIGTPRPSPKEREQRITQASSAVFAMISEGTARIQGTTVVLLPKFDQST